ncbi:MAG: hypothetical protein V4591_07785 [Bdellovibrionota bacterium]
MLRSYFIFIMLCSINIAFAETSSPLFNIETFCKTYTGQTDFLKDMSKNILKESDRRLQLVNMMSHNRAQGCQNAITDFLNKYSQDDSTADKPDGFESVLLLAFAAKMPEATKVIEKEITQGRLTNWLDVFQKSDREAYYKTLSQWVERVAQLIRNLDHAELVDEKLYGKISENNTEIKPPESISIWNPMIINKYMSEILEQKIRLSKNSFENLNIIYAASNQSYRDVFLTKMASVIELSQPNWVASFRLEPSWVQFRLFPVMGKVGGGFIKRELIWLAQYHQNYKLRALAQTTLEKVNMRSQSSGN